LIGFQFLLEPVYRKRKQEIEMNKTVNFNKNASVMIGENGKVRVRQIEVNGVQELQVRPTNRVNGRDLTDLREKKTSSGTPAKRVSLPADMINGVEYFSVEARKHGWLALVPSERQVVPVGQSAPAGASVER
jgi:hypothetical protein